MKLHKKERKMNRNLPDIEAAKSTFISLPKLWPLIFPYAVILAILHSIGLWSVFGINVFSFIDISQLLMLSAKALIFSCVAVIVGMMAGNSMATRKAKALNKTGFREKAIGFLISGIIFIVFVLGFVAIAMNHFLAPMALAGFASLFVCRQLFKINKNEIFFKNTSLDISVIWFMVILAFTTIASGNMEGNAIISGRSFYSTENSNCSPRYIGKAGDFWFFYHPIDQSVEYRISSSITSLKLYKKRNIKC